LISKILKQAQKSFDDASMLEMHLQDARDLASLYAFLEAGSLEQAKRTARKLRDELRIKLPEGL